jgi:hypothetical protein
VIESTESEVQSNVAHTQQRDKRCPKCEVTKALRAFYICKSRKDGHSSWCKQCSNTHRVNYKRSERKNEYRVVARAASRGEKPTHCPDCQNETPSHLMRGRLEGETILWSCFKCRSEMLASSTVRMVRVRKAVDPKPASIIVSSTMTTTKKYKRYCTWCCEPFMTANKNRIFCDKICVWTWFDARASRLVRESEADEGVRAMAPEAWVEAHEEAMTEATMAALLV